MRNWIKFKFCNKHFKKQDQKKEIIKISKIKIAMNNLMMIQTLMKNPLIKS